MTAQERNVRIARIKDLPQNLRNAVQGLNDEQLDTPYRDGGWTVRQVVHHVADSHLNAVIRMRLALTEENPTVKPYDQEAWARMSDYSLPTVPSLAVIEGVHTRWVHFLENLPDAAWTRTALHPDNGVMSLEDFLEAYAYHGDNHVAQITGLRARKGW
jgi:uncharacterized damage-inducible protein DinB